MSMRRCVFALVCLSLSACNEPPGAPTIALSPADPTTTEDLEVVFVAEAADPNDDPLTYTYLWFADGTLQADLTGPVVEAGRTAKGQTWKGIVVPSDGEFDGPPAAAEAVVVNTPPVAEASVSPAAPLSTEDVVASASATDADEDDVSLVIAWTLDGDDERVVEGAELPASETTKGEVWTVSATPNDGEEDGVAALASVSIENAAPVVGSVQIDPAEAREADTLTAIVSATDADNDDVSLDHAWWVSGNLVQEGESATLTAEGRRRTPGGVRAVPLTLVGISGPEPWDIRTIC